MLVKKNGEMEMRIGLIWHVSRVRDEYSRFGFYIPFEGCRVSFDFCGGNKTRKDRYQIKIT